MNQKIMQKLSGAGLMGAILVGSLAGASPAAEFRGGMSQVAALGAESAGSLATPEMAIAANTADAAGPTHAPFGDRQALPVEEPREPTLVLSREALAAREADDVANLEEVDNRDGTWSFALPRNFDTGMAVAGEMVTWRYIGQARYANEPKPVQGPQRFVVQEPKFRTPAEKLAAGRRIDSQGRIWQPIAVDAPYWAAMRLPGEDELERDSLPDSAPENEPLGDEYPVGSVVEWYPSSWTKDTCTDPNGNTSKTWVWEDEDRTEKTGTLTDRQDTTVKVWNFSSTVDTICTGTILTDDSILTSAHCVSDDDNDPIANRDISVCRYDGYNWSSDCRNVADIDFTSGYRGGSGDGGGNDFNDDWAILELRGSWSGTVNDMQLSQAGNSTLRDLDRVHNLGFPGFLEGCELAGGIELYHVVEREEIASVYRKSLRLKIDSAGGHSGGPFYYCPADDNNRCASGEKGYVIGVNAGWNGTRVIGPKAANFRDEAIAFITD